MKRIILLGTLVCAFSLVSCEKMTSKLMTKGTKEVTETVAKKAAKERVSDIATEGGQRIARQSLKEFASSDKVFQNLFEDFSTYISKNFAEDITVNTTKNGIELFSKEFPVSKIRVNGTLITGHAGSLKNAGPVNEFFNHLIPNRTYIIDDCFVYKTDNLGRVIECNAKRNKAYTAIERNTQRNSDVQRHVIEQLDGRKGLDDAGHLFANTTGGPNELINQVPMASELNRTGKWRELERIEEQALKDGKEVISNRKLIYKGGSKRPTAIEFTTSIDGVVTKTLVENI